MPGLAVRGGLDPVTMADILNVIRAELDGGPFGQRLRGGDQVLIPVAGMEGLLQLPQGRCIAQGEAPALGAAQADQVRAAAQRVTQVIGQRADVGAG